MISTFEHSAVQVNTGIFMSVMPGARIFTIVTKKLIAVMSVPIPTTAGSRCSSRPRRPD